MRLYHVTYDYLIGGKYRPQHTRFFARNAKEACRTIKDNYWEHIDFLCEKHNWSVSTARKNSSYPFHIKAERI